MRCPKCGAEDTVEVKRGPHEVAIATCTECDLHLVGHLEAGANPEDGIYFIVDSVNRDELT